MPVIATEAPLEQENLPSAGPAWLVKAQPGRYTDGRVFSASGKNFYSHKPSLRDAAACRRSLSHQENRMALFVYITCASPDEADRIGRALLDERLVACVNILPSPVRSLYLWKGQREEAEETVLVAKTMEDRFAALNRAVRRLHSYETPCVVALPLAAGDPDYLAWVEESTRPTTFV